MPDQVLGETVRVLRPGGKLLFKTLNEAHYIPLVARFTPCRFHQWINGKLGREETDTIPTRYRCNAPADVRAIACRAGLDVGRIDLIESRPEYLRISALTCILGLGYERLVYATDLLARFRILWIATLSKSARS